MPRSLTYILLLMAVAFAGKSFAGELRNELAGHFSPYLAMHGDDPVHWQRWGSDTLARARRENRLLFISSGYFACHWCHVMQRESYRNAAIAGLLNEHYIPVKIDRELQPALDAYLIEFVQRTRGHAGWPLNVFLTPEGYPLLGMTYLPANNFGEILAGLNGRWQADASTLRQLARDAAASAADRVKPGGPQAAAVDVQSLEKALVQQALQLGDELSGGFGNTTRFPSSPQLLALLEVLARRPDSALRGFLELTLRQMAVNGLRDQLGGGFFRYTTDPQWQVPHFEKMLYDNALLVRVYLRAATVLDRPELATVARNTMDFILATLASPDGGYIASLSAVDDQGVEGGYYLWSEADLKRVLDTRERRAVGLAWQMTGAPPLDGGFLPVQGETRQAVAAALSLSASEVDQLMAGAQRKLLQARQQRSLPRDTKRITAWTGLVLSALAALAGETDGARYQRAGEALYGRLAPLAREPGQLARVLSGDLAAGNAAIEDYAYLAQGLLDWAQQQHLAAGVTRAQGLVDAAWAGFYVDGRWREDQDLIIPYTSAERVLGDGPMPSPSAVLLDVTLRLLQIRPNKVLQRRVREASVASESVRAGAFFYASHVAVLGRYRLPAASPGYRDQKEIGAAGAQR